MNQEQFDLLTEQSEKTISAKVICDSVAPNGCRLTTMEWTYPRMIHSEIMTHRKLSRNAASSRAIPLAKMIQRVLSNPVFPIHWGKNQKGMQADEELSMEDKLLEGQEWMEDRNWMIASAVRSEKRGVHKQIGNRKLELWMWITVVISATNLENLFALRCHPAAEPHFQNLAYKIRDAYDKSRPDRLDWGGWHLPYFGKNFGAGISSGEHDYTIPVQDAPKISAGRCARVSYLTQDGKRDPAEDIKLYERLASSFPLHASPLEHPAQAVDPSDPAEFFNGSTGFIKEVGCSFDWGNFDPGWLQFRKMHENENVTKRTT